MTNKADETHLLKTATTKTTMQYKLVNSVHALPLLWGWQFCRVCVPAVVRRGSLKGHRWRPSFCLCWTISSCCELSDSAWCVTRQMKRLGWTVGCPQSGSQRGTKMNMTSIVLSDELSGFKPSNQQSRVRQSRLLNILYTTILAIYSLIVWGSKLPWIITPRNLHQPSSYQIKFFC